MLCAIIASVPQTLNKKKFIEDLRVMKGLFDVLIQKVLKGQV